MRLTCSVSALRSNIKICASNTWRVLIRNHWIKVFYFHKSDVSSLAQGGTRAVMSAP